MGYDGIEGIEKEKIVWRLQQRMKLLYHLRIMKDLDKVDLWMGRTMDQMDH